MTTICKECEKPFSVRNAERNRGNGRFCSISCGTRHSNNKRPKRGKRYYTYAEKKRKYGQIFMLNQIAGRIQGRAREAGIPCALTAPFLRSLFEKQKGRCYYTKRKMTLGVSTRKNIDIDQVSVDRINPKKGYVPGNIVLCCMWVNSAKGQSTLPKLLIRMRELLRYAA